MHRKALSVLLILCSFCATNLALAGAMDLTCGEHPGVITELKLHGNAQQDKPTALQAITFGQVFAAGDLPNPGCLQATVDGGASGANTTSINGFAGGKNAATQNGAATGYNTQSVDGSAAGDGATTRNGGASGAGTQSTDGFAGGYRASTENGGATGANATSTDGFAGGNSASTLTGAAVGNGATSITGFAGGEHATTRDGVAIGSHASAMPTNTVAIGTGAIAQAPNSVALGAGSIASARDTVSVGAPGSERRITNVAPGMLGTDAVNLNQLNTVRRDAEGGAAAAIAVAGLPQAYVPGRSMVAAAGGTYQGQTAVAIGLSTINATGRWVYKGAFTTNNRGQYGATLGAGYQW